MLSTLSTSSAPADDTVKDVTLATFNADVLEASRNGIVLACYQSRPVDAFAGALPEAQIKTWLDQLLKTTGAGGAETAGLETAYKQAAECLAAGDIATARAIYADILDMAPTNAVAYAGLIHCLLKESSAAEARQMLDAAPPDIAKDKALDPIRAALELAEQAQQGAGKSTELESALTKNPADHQARYNLALAYYLERRRRAQATRQIF